MEWWSRHLASPGAWNPKDLMLMHHLLELASVHLGPLLEPEPPQRCAKIWKTNQHNTLFEDRFTSEITYIELSSEINRKGPKAGLPFLKLYQCISWVSRDETRVRITCVVAEFSFRKVDRSPSNLPICSLCVNKASSKNGNGDLHYWHYGLPSHFWRMLRMHSIDGTSNQVSRGLY